MTLPASHCALEVAVESAIGARTARLAGADRVELCQALELGGLGPTAGQIETCLTQGIPTHVLIRPRPGNFVYEPGEVHSMVVDTADAVWRGASGVVIGALTSEGRLDLECIRRLANVARDAGATDVTVHRAIDRTIDPVAELAGLAEAGVNRVLTSGGQPTVGQGLSVGTLHRMINASGPITVMAGGGLALGDLPELLKIGVSAVHLSAARLIEPLDRGSAFGAEGHRVTDGELIASIRSALHR